MYSSAGVTSISYFSLPTKVQPLQNKPILIREGIGKMAKRPMRVIIVGAGLAGLVLAQGLQKNNIDVVIVDKETVPRDRNWCITMSWSLPLLEKLLPETLFNNMNLCQSDPTANPIEVGKHGVIIRDASTGEIKAQSQFPFIQRINHRKTKEHLSQGLSVQYGKRLSDISIDPSNDDEVTAHFEDGTTETGTLIVGADGGVSQVRCWLLGADAAAQEVIPCRFINSSFSLPSELAAWLANEISPTIDVSGHPNNTYIGLSLLDKPETANPETWVFYILAAWQTHSDVDSDDSRDILAELRSRMDGWTDPFKRVVENLPEDKTLKYEKLRLWHTKPWDNNLGRVTLVGDAAHSMTFHRGQGGNLAIKDAHELFNQIISVHNGDCKQKAAIDRYDKGALLRGEEVEISRQCTLAFFDWANIEKSPVMNLGLNPAMKF